VVCMNNLIYGMTGGQGSPTTPLGALSTTTPYGSSEPAFDLVALAVAAGANHVARWTAYHVREVQKAIQTGLRTPGLSFIEVRAGCPTNYGRKNRLREVTDMAEHFRTRSMLKAKFDRLVAEGRPIPPDTIVVGEFVRRALPAMGVAP
ncbi:MAG TPA: thiamine pyrophosphate-dependent enzyme, partial [Methanoregulaceae archaeon]|nr:thiamine pyrophosphate-dependent enzyme [Methanoregulaceae archaeon]